MKRKVKRALAQHEQAVTRVAQRLLIKMLKKLNIDYVRSGDKIISTRSLDVERLYNQAMMDVVVTFEQLDGNISDLMKFYGYKK